MINCQRIHNILLTSYIDAVSSPEETLLVDDHLKNCAACRDLLTSAKQIDVQLKDLPVINPPPQCWAAIQERLDHKTAHSLPNRIYSWLDQIFSALPQQTLAGLATVVILAGILPALLHPASPEATADESSAAIILANEREQTLYGTDVELGTATEYFIDNKGELI